MRGMEAIQRGATKSWQIPLPIDSLLNYNMLAGCFFCLFISVLHFTWFWTKLLESPVCEISFSLIQATESEAGTALASPLSGVIEVHGDNSVTFDGRRLGTATERKLDQLTFALQSRGKEQPAKTPVVVHASLQAHHSRIVHVIAALEQAGIRDYVLLFEGQSQDEPVWKGRR